MARFGRMFALGSGDGKTVPTKTSPSSLQKLWRTLSAEKKRVPLRFFTYPVKSTRVLFKEIELWERCKTTVICGMKSMTNTANVENAGSINNPPGWLWIYNTLSLSLCLYVLKNHWPFMMPMFNHRLSSLIRWDAPYTIYINLQNNCRIMDQYGITGWLC